MSDTAHTPSMPATPLPDVVNWGEQAPKGGRAVLNRMLREGTKVPLFLGQTFINSLRDVGYNNTIWAACEHVDNSIEWGAQEIRIYFHEYGDRGGKQKIDVAILDDGKGMEPNVLQVAMSFGGSMVFGRRSGIGRFGVGMKTAALSMGPRLDVYSWQERGTIYEMNLDLEEIGASNKNLIELPEPELRDRFPGQIGSLLTTPMEFPKNPELSQTLVSESEATLIETLPAHGTLVYLEDCDRLSNKTTRTLVENATKEMARIYRHFLSQGVKLFINNRQVEPFDPTYSMKNARHTRIEGVPQGDGGRLVNKWEIEIPVGEDSDVTAPASVRLYALPIDAWYGLPRNILTKSLRIFDDHQVSFMRNNREVHIGAIQELSGKKHGDAVWLRIQIDFDGRLDEAFGISMTKQGVRPRKYALDAIRKEINADVTRIREKTAAYRAQFSKGRTPGRVLDAERQANETDGLLGKPLPAPAPTTDDERKILESNLRTLATALKRADESDDDAFERLSKSKYVIDFRHDSLWPFYKVDFQCGKVILTINTAHAFYNKLYKPLEELTSTQPDHEGVDETLVRSTEAGNLLVVLQLMLLSLARTQSIMTQGDDRDGFRGMLQTFQREWSDNLDTQLTVG